MPIFFKLNTLRTSGRTRGAPPLFARVPLPAVYLRVFGTTKDSTGAALASCRVMLFRTADKVFVEEQTSDANGYYEFRSGSLTTQYFVVAYKSGGTDLAGTTINTLVAG